MITAGFVKNEQGVITPDPSVSQGRDLPLGGIASPTENNHALSKKYVDDSVGDVETQRLGTQPTAESGEVTITEGGFGRNHVSVLRLSQFIVGEMPGSATDSLFGSKLLTLPSTCVIHCVSADLEFSGAGADTSFETALGTDAIPEAVDNFASSANPENSNLTGGSMFSASVDGGDGSGVDSNTAVGERDIYLNVAGAWANDNSGDLTCSGDVIVSWTDMTVPA